MPMREMYDLIADPNETVNLTESHCSEADVLELELETWISNGLARLGRTEDPIVAQPITLGSRWDRKP